jgi:hypothetical protein
MPPLSIAPIVAVIVVVILIFTLSGNCPLTGTLLSTILFIELL